MERNPEHQDPDRRHGNFAEGLDHKPDPPEEALEPDFARGIRQDESELEEEGRFSEGVEQLPDDPEKTVERRFSEGIEENPRSE
jgi:hypothetical protein